MRMLYQRKNPLIIIDSCLNFFQYSNFWYLEYKAPNLIHSNRKPQLNIQKEIKVTSRPYLTKHGLSKNNMILDGDTMYSHADSSSLYKCIRLGESRCS